MIIIKVQAVPRSICFVELYCTAANVIVSQRNQVHFSAFLEDLQSYISQRSAAKYETKNHLFDTKSQVIERSREHRWSPECTAVKPKIPILITFNTSQILAMTIFHPKKSLPSGGRLFFKNIFFSQL